MKENSHVQQKRKAQEQTAIVCALAMVLIVLLAAGSTLCEVPQLILERLAWVKYTP